MRFFIDYNLAYDMGDYNSYYICDSEDPLGSVVLILSNEEEAKQTVDLLNKLTK